jgi:hypothetical protein
MISWMILEPSAGLAASAPFAAVATGLAKEPDAPFTAFVGA